MNHPDNVAWSARDGVYPCRVGAIVLQRLQTPHHGGSWMFEERFHCQYSISSPEDGGDLEYRAHPEAHLHEYRCVSRGSEAVLAYLRVRIDNVPTATDQRRSTLRASAIGVSSVTFASSVAAALGLLVRLRRANPTRQRAAEQQYRSLSVPNDEQEAASIATLAQVSRSVAERLLRVCVAIGVGMTLCCVLATLADQSL
ncbi:MAG: hypothetical protein JNK05_31865 [Myxococcales bacterium]|nr:hypothetical protein [Myxococcales bacterium]